MTAFRSFVLLVTLVFACVVPAWGAGTFGEPVAIVYPLTFSGEVSGNEAGADVAIVIAQKIAEGGGVIVRPYTPGTDRAHFLEATIAAKADYYITGFLQRLGPDVSMVVQVVSAHSGSVVYSTTATIRTYGDAAIQGDPLREAILRHAGRGYASLDAPPPVAPSPVSSATNGPGLNLTRALRRRGKAAPAPSPTRTSEGDLTPVSTFERPAESPSPKGTVTAAARAAASTAPELRASGTAPTPRASPAPRDSPSASTPSTAASAILILDTDGGESADMLVLAGNDLMNALRASGVRAARLPIGRDDTRKNANALCRANVGTVRFYAPSLILGHDEAGTLVARLSIESIDCQGATVTTRTTSGFGTARGGYASAIDRAAAKLVPLLAGV